jgi:hypothetical protein
VSDMSDEHEHVWVSVDFVRGGATTAWRGRMSSSDFEALIAGAYLGPFVRLERIHWWERFFDPVRKRNAVRLRRYGDDGECQDYDGVIYLRPDLIVDVALLKDCDSLFENEECIRHERPHPADEADPNPVVAKPVDLTSSGDHA